MESDADDAVPVEYKRGQPKDANDPLHPPELIQLYAQAALLRRHGYEVERGSVWFAGARRRVDIPIPADAEEQVRAVVDEVRQNASRGVAPPPLVDSPKCPHCVLVGLCLPDELRIAESSGGDRGRLIASDGAGRPLYLTDPRTSIGKSGGRLILRGDGRDLDAVRLIDVSHVAIFGNGGITSAAVRACAEAGLPILWLTSGGWLVAVATPPRQSDTRRRIAQHRAHAVGRLDIARAFVVGKIRNTRTLLRRLGNPGEDILDRLKAGAEAAAVAADVPALLGVEGAAGRTYFSRFSTMLRTSLPEFAFEGRNRRPPLDPVNALLSLAYALLTKDCAVALWSAGLDPHVGILHRPGFARPALALDLMEEFRPIVADSVVVRAVNNGEVQRRDFIVTRTACSLTREGRRKFIASYERRMAQEITHPVFGYGVSYRRCLELQARLLSAVLVGELDEYRPLTTR